MLHVRIKRLAWWTGLLCAGSVLATQEEARHEELEEELMLWHDEEVLTMPDPRDYASWLLGGGGVVAIAAFALIMLWQGKPGSRQGSEDLGGSHSGVGTGKQPAVPQQPSDPDGQEVQKRVPNLSAQGWTNARWQAFSVRSNHLINQLQGQKERVDDKKKGDIDVPFVKNRCQWLYDWGQLSQEPAPSSLEQVRVEQALVATKSQQEPFKQLNDYANRLADLYDLWSRYVTAAHPDQQQAVSAFVEALRSYVDGCKGQLPADTVYIVGSSTGAHSSEASIVPRDEKASYSYFATYESVDLKLFQEDIPHRAGDGLVSFLATNLASDAVAAFMKRVRHQYPCLQLCGWVQPIGAAWEQEHRPFTALADWQDIKNQTNGEFNPSGNKYLFYYMEDYEAVDAAALAQMDGKALLDTLLAELGQLVGQHQLIDQAAWASAVREHNKEAIKICLAAWSEEEYRAMADKLLFEAQAAHKNKQDRSLQDAQRAYRDWSEVTKILQDYSVRMTEAQKADLAAIQAWSALAR